MVLFEGNNSKRSFKTNILKKCNSQLSLLQGVKSGQILLNADLLADGKSLSGRLGDGQHASPGGKYTKYILNKMSYEYMFKPIFL